MKDKGVTEMEVNNFYGFVPSNNQQNDFPKKSYKKAIVISKKNIANFY